MFKKFLFRQCIVLATASLVACGGESEPEELQTLAPTTLELHTRPLQAEPLQQVPSQQPPQQAPLAQALPKQALPVQSPPQQAPQTLALPVQSPPAPAPSLPVQSPPQQAPQTLALPVQSPPAPSLPVQSPPQQAPQTLALPVQSPPAPSLPVQSPPQQAPLIQPVAQLPVLQSAPQQSRSQRFSPPWPQGVNSHQSVEASADMASRQAGYGFQTFLVLGGNISGLEGTLVLQNNMLDDETLQVSTNGEFLFQKFYSRFTATEATSYNIGVLRQPEGQSCSLTAASGDFNTHILNVKVTCSSAQVSTFAGSGVKGSIDGLGRAATFDSPYGIVVDSNDGLLVADWGSHRVRKISPAGQVSLVAHTMSHPTGLAADSMDNIYVVSPSNDFVRKLIPAGGHIDIGAGPASAIAMQRNGDGYYIQAETLYRFSSSRINQLTAQGWQAPANGIETLKFKGAEGMAVDAAGNIYVSETNLHRILKITPSGAVGILAGTGEPGSDDKVGDQASFNFPSGLALDSQGNLLVADTQNHTVRKITPQGIVSTIAGKALVTGSKDGAGVNARFVRPRGVAIGADDALYVSDTGNHLIRKIVLRSQ